jgi:polyadenylate-binding protein 2
VVVCVVIHQDDEKELEEMKKRVQEMEEEARKLKEMQEQVESLNAGSALNKEEADARSVYVGNVRHSYHAQIEVGVMLVLNEHGQ